MNYEWDQTKRQFNLETHGLDFVDVTDFNWDSAVIMEDTRRDYSETRYIAYGFLQGRLSVLVFTPRSESIRVISLRKANSREVKLYEFRITN